MCQLSYPCQLRINIAAAVPLLSAHLLRGFMAFRALSFANAHKKAFSSQLRIFFAGAAHLTLLCLVHVGMVCLTLRDRSSSLC
jgi:hypothetical protein